MKRGEKPAVRCGNIFEWVKAFIEDAVYALVTVMRYAFYPYIYVRKGACKQCGRCCRCVYLRDHSRIVSSFDQYLHLVIDDPMFKRFEVKGRDEDGYLYFGCSLVTAGNTCGDYEKRPFLCKHYPDIRMVVYGATPKDACGFYFVNRWTGQRFVM